jgi:hypothetical protein
MGATGTGKNSFEVMEMGLWKAIGSFILVAML